MKRAYMKYIAALLLFGSNGIVASRIALSSHEIVLLRTLLGGLLLMLLCFAQRKGFRFCKERRSRFFLCASGAAMGASWLCLFEAYARIGVGLSSLLYYCGPVFVMALSPFLFQEKLNAAKITGFILVLCGMCMLQGKAAVKNGHGLGYACGAISALLYACMVLCNKKATGIEGLENAALQLCTAFLTVAAYTLSKQGFALRPAPSDMLPVLVLGLVNTGLGCYLYFSSIGALPVQAVAICGYLEPLSAVLFSVAILGERLSPAQGAGAFLIIGGALLAQYRRIRPPVGTKT